jgi:hypothetical protein
MIALTLAPGWAAAGSWTIEPKLSLQADYATNPSLTLGTPLSEYGAAVLAELPTTYTAGSDSFALLPRIRLGDAHTYASFNSNYWYLDAVATMNHERVQANLTAGASSDSTLNSGLESAQIGKPNTKRDGREAAANWQYVLSERSNVALNANWTRALFEPSSGVQSYDYWTAGTTYQYTFTPRLGGSLGVSAGYFRLLTGATTGETINVPLGLKYQLNPLWNVSLTAGASRARNNFSQQVLVPTIPPMAVQYTVRQSSSAPIFSAALQRTGERSTLLFAADRVVQPTGFGTLSVQEDASVSGSYQPTERWAVSGSTHWLQARDPYANGTHDTRRRFDVEGDLVWHWRPVWDVTLRLVRTNFRYQYLQTDEATNSTGVYLLLTRIFGIRPLR